MSDTGQYVVTGCYGSIRITYNCPTVGWALKKVRDFHHAGYEDINTLAPDGQFVTEADLATLAEGYQASEASIEANAPDFRGVFN